MRNFCYCIECERRLREGEVCPVCIPEPEQIPLEASEDDEAAELATGGASE